MTNELEKQFFDTFEIEPKDNFKGCESGITFYTYGCNMPSCKGCSKEIREKDYPQITDTHYLKLICIISQEWDSFVILKRFNLDEFKREILLGLIRTKNKFYNQVRTLFKES